MKILRSVTLEELQAHERELTPSPNVRLGGYNMPPPAEFAIWLAALEEVDLSRLYLLYDFTKYTVGHSSLVRDLRPEGDFKTRVEMKIVAGIDLRESPQLAVEIVTGGISNRPLIIFDGNHRITAQQTKHGSIEGVFAFVCEHRMIPKWGNVPVAARW